MNAYQRQKAAEPDVRPSNFVAMKAFAGPGSEDSPMRALLGAGGSIAQSLPGYQERDSQIVLADAIHQGLEQRRHVIAEAGTGTGKSLAALVPSISYAKKHGGAMANRRILVSTAMIILQDQYVKKDLPFLTKHLGIDFEWTVRKGRSNYLCLERLDRIDAGLFDEHADELKAIEEWAYKTDSGDVAELPFELAKLPKLKAKVTANSDNCKGSKCGYAERTDGQCECFYYTSKDRSMTCEIIVVNHSLLVANEIFDQMILPAFDAIIIDEAHKLEDIVRSSLQVTVKPDSMKGLLKAAEESELFAPEKIAQWDSASEKALAKIETEVGRLLPSPGVYRFQLGSMPKAFSESLDTLILIVQIIFTTASQMEADAEAMGTEEPLAKRIVQRCSHLWEGLQALKAAERNWVVWAERTKGKERDVLSLNVAPLHVGEWMQEHILKTPCVFVSATLATGKGDQAFTSFKERLGVESAIELQVESPFDYLANCRYALGYYPGGLDQPPKDGLEWAALVGPRVAMIANVTGGGMLALFTSWTVCNEVYQYLWQHTTGLSLLCQGEMSKHELIESFRSKQNSVLCATGSFFEGVDIPGSALRCVVIDKIPFPILGDPIQAAISEALGRDSFKKHWIPHAITHLKQGAGRLLRSETDRGMVLLLDPRFRSKGYGKQLLSALPGYQRPALADEIQEFMEGYR